MDMLANTFMRAPGESIGTFALECAIDELAERAGARPDRAAAAQRAGAATRPSGTPFSSRHLRRGLPRGAERFGWDAARSDAAARRATATGWSAWACATAYLSRTTACRAARRASRSTRDGRAIVSMARRTRWAWARPPRRRSIAADRLGLPMEQRAFRVRRHAPAGGPLAGGSSQTASIGAAVHRGARRAASPSCSKLAGNDSPLAGLKPTRSRRATAGFASATSPSGARATPRSCARAGRDERRRPRRRRRSRWRRMNYSMHSLRRAVLRGRASTRSPARRG